MKAIDGVYMSVFFDDDDEEDFYIVDYETIPQNVLKIEFCLNNGKDCLLWKMCLLFTMTMLNISKSTLKTSFEVSDFRI